MTYEYRPTPDKRKEKLLALLFGGVGLGAYASSLSRYVPYPALLQLAAVLLLTLALALVGRYLLRNFCYTVAPRRDGGENAPDDLTVTELYGRRRSVVCILSLAEIRGVTPVSGTDRKTLRAMTQGATIYRYVASLWSADAYLLEIEHEEMRFFLKIHADKALLDCITPR